MFFSAARFLNLSFSSIIIFLAVLVPIPGTEDKTFSSPPAIREIIVSIFYLDKIEIADFGPTPPTLIKFIKTSFSSSLPNPYSVIESSL